MKINSDNKDNNYDITILKQILLYTRKYFIFCPCLPLNALFNRSMTINGLECKL